MDEKTIKFLSDEIAASGEINIEKDKIDMGKVIFPDSAAFHDLGYEIIYVEIYGSFSISKLSEFGHENGMSVHSVIEQIKHVLKNEKLQRIFVDSCFQKSEKLKDYRAKSTETEINHELLKDHGTYAIQINAIAEEA